MRLYDVVKNYADRRRARLRLGTTYSTSSKVLRCAEDEDLAAGLETIRNTEYFE